MRLGTGLAALGVMLSLAQAFPAAQANLDDDAQAGRTAWAEPTMALCRTCHGEQGEGVLGPELAGRQLTATQFRRAVRTPRGVMPAFAEAEVSDRDLADVAAYLRGLPREAPAVTPPGDPEAGRSLWTSGATACRNCHGAEGEGRWGPDLAGRDMSVAWFTRAVRDPVDRMPAYVESQLSHREIVDVVAFLNSLPGVDEPGPWRFTVPPGAPPGQEIALATAGCGQCHGLTLETPRRGAGTVDADFDWFARQVYEHTTAMPEQYRLGVGLGVDDPAHRARSRMGNYRRSRLPESQLRAVWTFMRDQGLIVPVMGRLSPGVDVPEGVQYTVTVENRGVSGRGLAAEDLTITMALPDDVELVSSTETGYEGVRRDQQEGSRSAVWRLPHLAAGDFETYTITLSRAVTPEDSLRGVIRWMRPTTQAGPGVTNIAPSSPR